MNVSDGVEGKIKNNLCPIYHQHDTRVDIDNHRHRADNIRSERAWILYRDPRGCDDHPWRDSSFVSGHTAHNMDSADTSGSCGTVDVPVHEVIPEDLAAVETDNNHVNIVGW